MSNYIIFVNQGTGYLHTRLDGNIERKLKAYESMPEFVGVVSSYKDVNLRKTLKANYRR